MVQQYKRWLRTCYGEQIYTTLSAKKLKQQLPRREIDSKKSPRPKTAQHHQLMTSPSSVHLSPLTPTYGTPNGTYLEHVVTVGPNRKQSSLRTNVPKIRPVEPVRKLHRKPKKGQGKHIRTSGWRVGQYISGQRGPSMKQKHRTACVVP